MSKLASIVLVTAVVIYVVHRWQTRRLRKHTWRPRAWRDADRDRERAGERRREHG